MTRARARFPLLLLAGCAMACARHRPSTDDDAYFRGDHLPGGTTTVADASANGLGRAAHNLHPTRWPQILDGKRIFQRRWSGEEGARARGGLGPHYNAICCDECHFKDGRGGRPSERDPDVRLLARLISGRASWVPDVARDLLDGLARLHLVAGGEASVTPALDEHVAFLLRERLQGGDGPRVWRPGGRKGDSGMGSIEGSGAGGGEGPEGLGRELVRLHPELRARALFLTQGDAAADDLVQDVLERAWLSRHRFQPGTNLKAWLNAIMRNLWIDTHRQRASRLLPSLHPEPAASAEPGSPLDLVTMEDVLDALSMLKPSDREIFRLATLEGLTYRAVAVRLGIPTNTAGTRLRRVRSRLRRLLTRVYDIRRRTTPNASPLDRPW